MSRARTKPAATPAAQSVVWDEGDVYLSGRTRDGRVMVSQHRAWNVGGFLAKRFAAARAKATIPDDHKLADGSDLVEYVVLTKEEYRLACGWATPKTRAVKGGKKS